MFQWIARLVKMNNSAPHNRRRNEKSLWYSLKWCFLHLIGIRWQIHITHGPCHFRHQAALCRLIPCRFRHCIGWSHFPPWIARIPREHHKILKTLRILIIFLYFMGNYATCKKYTQKEKNQFILLTRSHFSLIAKKLCQSRNTDSSWRMLNSKIEMVWKATLTKVPEILKTCLHAE